MALRKPYYFYGKQAKTHLILHKNHLGGGLIEDLQTQGISNGSKHKIGSMDHKEYFEKYLREPEGFDRLTEAVSTIVKYYNPLLTTTMPDICVEPAEVPYLKGINKLAEANRRRNINHIFVIFENFPRSSGTSETGSSGHFMLLWRFPISFDKKKHAAEKYCLFDPFGRARPQDPETAYFQKTVGRCFQWPESDTCALWTVFALLRYCLQVATIPGIVPVEYDGSDDKLDDANFITSYHDQWMKNEQRLYRYLVDHYVIFLPNAAQTRPIFDPYE